PYTRGGKLLDDQDNRAKPLLHLLDQLERMSSPPTYVFLENVKNFEVSRSRERLVRLLNKMGYVFRECLLAPYNFGVPNDRLRYFLMARLRSSFKQDTTIVPTGSIAITTTTITTTTTATTTTAAAAATSSSTAPESLVGDVFDPEKELIYTTWPFPAFVEDPKTPVQQHSFKLPELRHFLDKDETHVKDYLLSKQLILERPNFRFDILRPSSNRSSCFTKAYGGHHVASGGGLLQTLKMEQEDYDFGNSESIAELGLRFFSPTEVARLHVFPLKEEHEYGLDGDSNSNSNNHNKTNGSSTSENDKDADSIQTTQVHPNSQQTVTTVRPFDPQLARKPEGPFLQFPHKLKALQRYKLLGNSLNVWVVAELLRGILFADHPGTPLPVYRTSDESSKPLESTSKHSIDKHSESIESEQNTVEDEARNPKRLKTQTA
ncbi:tRNA (cytosine-5-)-methyltransferase, partial [Lobosporangium transversale]